MALAMGADGRDSSKLASKDEQYATSVVLVPSKPISDVQEGIFVTITSLNIKRD